MSTSGSPMRDFLTRHREGLLLGVLLSISLLTVSHQVRDDSGVTYLRRTAITVVSPFQAAVSGVIISANHLWSDYLYLVGVRAENKLLTSDLNRMQGEIQELKEELYRAGRMEKFEVYLSATGMKGVAARIIGASPDPWTRTIVLNRGYSEGVRTGMPVVTPEGLVGRVIESASGSAVVRLIVDRSSNVPVLIRRSRGRAILEGENASTCQLKYLDRIEDVVTGDVVITSGLAGVYPRGIEVGTISQIVRQNHGLYQYAKLTPHAPIGRLEDVLVVTEVEDLRDVQ
jgi:rod shape-determining protein MreC